jgi:hypothetical protein
MAGRKEDFKFPTISERLASGYSFLACSDDAIVDPEPSDEEDYSGMINPILSRAAYISPEVTPEEAQREINLGSVLEGLEFPNKKNKRLYD